MHQSDWSKRSHAHNRFSILLARFSKTTVWAPVDRQSRGRGMVDVQGGARLGSLLTVRMMKYLQLALLLPNVFNALATENCVSICNTIADEDCISTYSQLERSIVQNSTINLDNMLKVFFPPNELSPAAIHVIYHVTYVDDENSTDCKVIFHWSHFLVSEVIRPDLLEQLSYFIYHRHYNDDNDGKLLKDLDIYVSAPFCSQHSCPRLAASDRFEEDCNEEKKDTPLTLLNLFTTQVSDAYITSLLVI